MTHYSRARVACTLQASQFFSTGFVECKITLVCDVIKLCKQKHAILWKQEREQKMTVSSKNYRPNRRLEARRCVRGMRLLQCACVKHGAPAPPSPPLPGG